jgi:hypothetical protein
MGRRGKIGYLARRRTSDPADARSGARMRFLTTADVLIDKREFHMPTKINTKISTGQQALAL